jgi:hypothetical protein
VAAPGATEPSDDQQAVPPIPAPAGPSPATTGGAHGREHRLGEDGRALLHDDLVELHHLEQRVAERFSVSTPAKVWTRLNAVDFMDSSIQFAALALLCLFPFLIIVAAEWGGDLRPALIRRLGLNHEAANDVYGLMSPGKHVVATLDVLGLVLVVLGAFGIASTLQAWYRRVYDQPSHSGWMRLYTARFMWLIGFVLYLAVQDLLNRHDARLAARIPSTACTSWSPLPSTGGPNTSCCSGTSPGGNCFPAQSPPGSA